MSILEKFFLFIYSWTNVAFTWLYMLYKEIMIKVASINIRRLRRAPLVRDHDHPRTGIVFETVRVEYSPGAGADPGGDPGGPAPP